MAQWAAHAPGRVVADISAAQCLTLGGFAAAGRLATVVGCACGGLDGALSAGQVELGHQVAFV
jgi:hypothetical protein